MSDTTHRVAWYVDCTPITAQDVTGTVAPQDMTDDTRPIRDNRTCTQRQDATIADLTARITAVETQARAQAANTYQFVAALEALERRVAAWEAQSGDCLAFTTVEGKFRTCDRPRGHSGRHHTIIGGRVSTWKVEAA